MRKKGITRSISRKGMPSDNAPIECFHSSLKCETFYLKKALKSFNNIVLDRVENYIEKYNKVRIKQKLGYFYRNQEISSLGNSIFIKLIV